MCNTGRYERVTEMVTIIIPCLVTDDTSFFFPLDGCAHDREGFDTRVNLYTVT